MARETIIITAGSFSTSNVFGGHYRSASAIAELLSEDYRVLLVNVGTRPSPVMKAAGQETIYVKGQTAAPYRTRRQLSALMHMHKVKAVVAFDQKVGELFRPLARRLGTGFVLVKPGGGQPRLYYPKAKHQIVFMESDRAWVEAAARTEGVTVRQAAGRIFPPTQDPQAQEALRQHLGLQEGDLAILRIGRINEQYAAASRAALALSAFLRDQGFRARAILIGTPESSGELAALERAKGAEDAIVTDPLFTNDASRLLSLFRFNVGTGRGFMEGCNVGHIMFCASQSGEHNLPLLVNEENFGLFFEQNFSPRIRPDTTREANAARIVDLMRNFTKQEALSARAKGWFEDNFSAESSRRIYVEMIEAAARDGERFNADHVRSELHLRVSVLMDRIRTFLHRRMPIGRHKT